MAPLFSFAALVADVSISVDALAMLFGCHVGRNVAVVYGCDNELMEAKVHKVGQGPAFVVSKFKIAYRNGV